MCHAAWIPGWCQCVPISLLNHICCFKIFIFTSHLLALNVSLFLGSALSKPTGTLMSLELFMTSCSATKIRYFLMGLKRDKRSPNQGTQALALELIASDNDMLVPLRKATCHCISTPHGAPCPCLGLWEAQGDTCRDPVHSDPSWQTEKAELLLLQVTLTFFS